MTTRGHKQDAPRPWCRKSKSAPLSTFPTSCTDPNLGVAAGTLRRWDYERYLSYCFYNINVNPKTAANREGQ